MQKLVSIILPAYNGSKWINEAVESVINQSYTDWELLVVDDGSTDNTEAIITEYIQKDSRIRYIKNEQNLGIQKSLNRGLKEVKGEYVARIDSDDEWCDNDKLKKQIQFLESNQDYVLVGTGAVVISEDGNELFRYLVPQNDKDIRNRILGKNCFIHSSVIFRKDAVIQVGGYSENQDVLHLEDYDLWLKLGQIGKMINLGEYSIKLRLSDGSLSALNKISQFKKSLKLINKFKNFYPNYFWAYFRNVARLLIYGFILKLPVKFSLNKIIKIYKEN